MMVIVPFLLLIREASTHAVLWIGACVLLLFVVIVIGLVVIFSRTKG
jgi:hypothetical protein